jgi:hypothetical protein
MLESSILFCRCVARIRLSIVSRQSAIWVAIGIRLMGNHLEAASNHHHHYQCRIAQDSATQAFHHEAESCGGRASRYRDAPLAIWIATVRLL